jgi:hypothetical protein
MRIEYRKKMKELQSKIDYQCAARAMDRNQSKEEMRRLLQTHDSAMEAMQSEHTVSMQRTNDMWQERIQQLGQELHDTSVVLRGTEDRLQVRGKLLMGLEADNQSLRKLSRNALSLLTRRVGSVLRVGRRHDRSKNKITKASNVHSLDGLMKQQQQQQKSTGTM